jgi:hypothetical protein
MQGSCRETNTSRCITRAWLNQNIFGGQVRANAADTLDLWGGRNNPGALSWNERVKSSNGFGEHGVAAHNGEQLLGASSAAFRPETSAGTSGHDDGVQHGFSLGKSHE